MALTKVTKSGVDKTIISGQDLLDAQAANTDQLLIYDVDADAIKRIVKTNISEAKPTVTGITVVNNNGGYIATSTATSITVSGTGFASIPTVTAVNSSTGAIFTASVVSFTNSTTLSTTFNIDTNGDYYVRVENPSGLAGISASTVLGVSPGPVWYTAAGSLGSVTRGDSINIPLSAYTSDSSAITFTETTAVLTSNADTPATTANLSLNANDGTITGTAPTVTSDTTYTFTLRATDAQSQFADRQFTLTVTANYFGDGSDGALDTTP